MKVTFIQPYYHNVWEALGVGYLIAYLKQEYKGQIDIEFFQGFFDDNIDIVLEARDSDIVFFSCTSPAYEHGLKLARAIKLLSFEKIPPHIVFGGWHPTAVPEEVIKEDCVDQVVVGEGEAAMMYITYGGREPIVKDLHLTPPIVYFHPPSIDKIPWPDREAICNYRTIDLCESMNGKRTASFQLNRGCKVHCRYCAEIKMTGRYNKTTNPIRTRSVVDVMDEIESVAERYNLNYFKFVDATFDRDIQIVKDFCNEKCSRDNDLGWEANIHPAFVQDEEVFEYLAHSNCKQINVGVESGSQKILNAIGKGTKVEHIIKVFDWAKKYNIESRAFFLLGMPEETSDDLSLTEQLIDRIQPDYSGFTILCPYPGSDFYSKGWKNVDWSKTDEYSNDFWMTYYHSNERLKDIQRHFTERYKGKLCERQAE